MRYEVSFAAIFSKGNMLEPFCALCFFSNLPAQGAVDDVQGYLVQRFIPSLIQTIASKDELIVLRELQTALVTMRDALGVQCSAFLPDSVLTIQSGGETREKSGEEAEIMVEKENSCFLRAAEQAGSNLHFRSLQTSLLLSVLLPQREAQPCVCRYAMIRLPQGDDSLFERCLHDPAVLCSLSYSLEDGGEESLAAIRGLLSRTVGLPVEIWPISMVGYYHLE